MLFALPGARASIYYLPYYADSNGVATGLGLTNLSTKSNAKVKIMVYGRAANLIKIHRIQLNPRGQWRGFVGDNSAQEGWIQIDSDQLLAGLCFAFKDDYMMDVTITEILSKKLVVPHAAQSPSWDTIVYIANPNSKAASGTLRFRNANGKVIATQPINMPAMGSQQIFLSQVLGTTEVSGGSVLVECNQEITGFALYQNLKTGQHSYAGINAVPLEDNTANYDMFNYFPFKSGNEWTFDSPSENNITITYNTEYFTHISRKATEVHWFEGYKYPGFMFTDDNGYYAAATKERDNPEEDEIFDPPLQILGRYYSMGEVKTGSWNDISISTKLQSKEDVITPAGTFKDCLKIVYNIDDIEGFYKEIVWFAKGIGPVKIQRPSEDPVNYDGCLWSDGWAFDSEFDNVIDRTTVLVDYKITN